MRQTYGIGAFVGVPLAAVLLLAGCGGGSEDARAEGTPGGVAIGTESVAIVTTDTLSSGPAISGALAAEREATVRAQVPGAVLDVLVDQGSRVTAGAVLARIDQRTLQDAFLSALRKLRSFRGEAAFTTWLHRVTVNACYDLLRKRQRSPLLHERPDDEPERRPEPTPSPDHADDTALSIDVQRALLEVPEDFRVVMILHDVQDLPQEEVAATLGIPVGTVKSRLHRGRVALARALGERPRGERERPPAPVLEETLLDAHEDGGRRGELEYAHLDLVLGPRRTGRRDGAHHERHQEHREPSPHGHASVRRDVRDDRPIGSGGNRGRTRVPAPRVTRPRPVPGGRLLGHARRAGGSTCRRFNAAQARRQGMTHRSSALSDQWEASPSTESSTMPAMSLVVCMRLAALSTRNPMPDSTAIISAAMRSSSAVPAPSLRSAKTMGSADGTTTFRMTLQRPAPNDTAARISSGSAWRTPAVARLADPAEPDPAPETGITTIVPPATPPEGLPVLPFDGPANQTTHWLVAGPFDIGLGHDGLASLGGEAKAVIRDGLRFPIKVKANESREVNDKDGLHYINLKNDKSFKWNHIKGADLQPLTKEIEGVFRPFPAQWICSETTYAGAPGHMDLRIASGYRSYRTFFLAAALEVTPGPPGDTPAPSCAPRSSRTRRS